jgi:hypothetical protein
MSCGIENPQPIEECTGPGQCCPGNRRRGGTEEQENTDGSYSARHLVPTRPVGGSAMAVFPLLTILKLESAESFAVRPKRVAAAIVGDFLCRGLLPLRLGYQFEVF